MHKNKITLKNISLVLKHHLTDQPYDYPKKDEDLNVVSLGLNLESFYKDLLQYSKDFDVKKIENIKYKGEKLPIYQIDINKKAAKKIFILSGTHGYEQAGILCIPPLLNDIKRNPDFYKNVQLRIVAPHNPVSAKEFSRYNANGIDINRDFKKRRTKEVKAVIKSIEEFDPAYSISLHEGPQEQGTFIYTNKLVDDEFALKVLNYAKKKGVNLAPKNYFGRALKTPGLFPLKGVTFHLTKIWSDILQFQTFGYYTYTKVIKNMTIETPWQNESKEERINAQLAFIKGVVENI